MKILIKPTDIIERALWDKYFVYCIKDKKSDIESDIESYIKTNTEFEITEQDALVIGLLKCIETDNLVHRCNNYVMNYISTMSTELEVKKDSGKKFYMVKKKNFSDALISFKRNFPPSWKPDGGYKKGLSDVLKYIDLLVDKTEKLDTFKYTDKFGTYDYIYCNHVKKMLNLYNN